MELGDFTVDLLWPSLVYLYIVGSTLAFMTMAKRFYSIKVRIFQYRIINLAKNDMGSNFSNNS